MKQRYLHKAAVSLLLSCLSTHSVSEVYQWTDAQGRMHFSDRAPQKIQANNISSQLEQINITSDLSSPEMMLRHEQTKDAEREKHYKEQLDRDQNRTILSESCKEAKKRLELVRGRVIFLDEQGKEVKVSEKNRKNRALELEHEVRKHCY